MTDHPCKGMTKPQIATFERIAIGQPPYASERTLKILLARGVIEKEIRNTSSGIGNLMIRYAVYHVPLPVHMQWCKWCSEQPDIASLS